MSWRNRDTKGMKKKRRRGGKKQQKRYATETEKVDSLGLRGIDRFESWAREEKKVGEEVRERWRQDEESLAGSNDVGAHDE